MERELTSEIALSVDFDIRPAMDETIADLRDGEIQAKDPDWDGGVVDWSVGNPHLDVRQGNLFLVFPIEVTYTATDDNEMDGPVEDADLPPRGGRVSSQYQGLVDMAREGGGNWTDYL